MDVLVPDLVDVAVMFIARQGVLQCLSSAHINPQQQGLLDEFCQVHQPTIDDPLSVFARVLRTGEGVLLPPLSAAQLEQIPDERKRRTFRALGARTIIVVPLGGQSGRYGVLAVAVSATGRRLDDHDLELMTRLAEHVGPVLQRWV
jgi:GAF domain-containing protein